MKKYRQAVNIRVHRSATNRIPVLPELETGEPPLGIVIARWYDNNGNYLGWNTPDVTKKFLLTKLYYKTKGAYRVSTRNERFHGVKKISITEKNNGDLGALVIIRELKDDDLVDTDNKKEISIKTLEQVKDWGVSVWNFTAYPNPYKIIPAEFTSKFTKEMDDFLKAKKQELIDYVTNHIADIDQAEEINKKNAEQTGGDWDPSGLL